VRISSGRFLGLGLAVPGLVNEPAGTVAMSPNLHFLDGKPFARDLEMLLGQKVVCTQEEHALCLAEQSLGGAQAYSDYAVLDISSGMGMGVVSGGHYISGRHGFAGEIGHVTVDPDGAICGCGNRGCLETVATDTALLHAVRRRIGRDITFDELIRDVASGALDVSAELDRTLNFLAIALAAVANLFNVESIFLYGRLFDLDANVLPRLIDLMRMRALAPSFADVVVTRSHGSKLYGAFAGLLDDVFAAVGPRLS
jgi:N-acetylglucosamine repressor